MKPLTCKTASPCADHEPDETTRKIADLIHERKYDCSDPVSGKGRDCADCLSLASDIMSLTEEAA